MPLFSENGGKTLTFTQGTNRSHFLVFPVINFPVVGMVYTGQQQLVASRCGDIQTCPLVQLNEERCFLDSGGTGSLYAGSVNF